MFKSSDEAKAANARGNARQVELREEMKEAVRVNGAAMIAGLGRPAAPDEVSLAELICAGLLRAARLRNSGRDDLAIMREVALMLRDWRALPRGPVPATEPSA